jgi:hypothetical protein
MMHDNLFEKLKFRKLTSTISPQEDLLLAAELAERAELAKKQEAERIAAYEAKIEANRLRTLQIDQENKSKNLPTQAEMRKTKIVEHAGVLLEATGTDRHGFISWRVTRLSDGAFWLFNDQHKKPGELFLEACKEFESQTAPVLI